MFKQLLTLIFVSLAVCASARPITPDEATAVATEFLNSLNTSKSSLKKSGVQPVRKQKSESTENSSLPFYVFNADDGEGFVIVSGDNRAKKILGYSDTGSFDLDNMPPQLIRIFNQFTEQLKTFPDNNTSTHPSWLESDPIPSEGVVLKTANWSQDYPFNAQCPKIDGNETLTGCVATAVSIIMKYHEWPRQGRDSHNYNLNGQEVAFNYEEAFFDWSLMPNKCEENDMSDAQIHEISKLMRAVGNAIDMQYSPSESSAYTSSIPYNIYRYFKYKVPKFQCNYETQFHPYIFTDEDWLNIIKAEIDCNRPLLYSARKIDDSIGHAFVVDGYDNTSCHVNWGWNGSANGYYAINDFLGYVDSPELLTNIEPDFTAGDNFEKIFLDDGRSVRLTDLVPINLSFINLEPYEWYDGYSTIIVSEDLKKEVGDISVTYAVINTDGMIKYLSDHVEHLYVDEGVRNTPIVCDALNDCVVYCDVEPNDRIAVAWKGDNENVWHILKTISEDLTNSIPVVGNSPDIINLNIIADDGIDELYIQPGSLVDGDIHKIIKRINVGENISAKSECGVPIIFIDGTKGSVYSSPGEVYAPFWRNKDHEVIVRLVRYDEMSDLAIDVQAGKLHEQLSLEEAHRVSRLKVSGEINTDDLYYLRDNCWVISLLDLSDTKIVPDNYIPAYAFASEGVLQNLILPRELKGFRDHSMYLSTFGYFTGHLNSLEIPETATNFEGLCFGGDIYNLIVKNPDPSVYHSCVILNTMSGCSTLWVPVGSKEKYQKSVLSNSYSLIEELDGDFVCPESVSPKLAEVKLNVGESIILDVSVNPDNANFVNSESIFRWWKGLGYDNVEYNILPDNATKLEVRATSKGENVIFMRMDPYQYVSTYNIIIMGKDQKITWNQDIPSMYVGDEIELTATCDSGLDIQYSVSDNALCYVEGNRLLATGIGTVEIVASQPGNQEYETAEDVKKTIQILAENLTLSVVEWSGKVGESVTLSATVFPDTGKSVTWSSSNEGVATVDTDGKVTAVSLGTATITATSGSVSATCEVTVVSTPAESISLDRESAQLKVGESIAFEATVLPGDATDKSVVWSTSDEAVATVDGNGNVTAIDVGEAIITATTTDGSGISASCHVTVLAPEKGDSNVNGTVNIADAVNTANYAVGIEVEKFYFEAADVNEDNSITLADASGTVTIILNQPVDFSAPDAMRVNKWNYPDLTSDRLVIEDYSTGIDSGISVTLENSIDYVALQADVRVPAGMTLQKVEQGDGAVSNHLLLTKRIDDRTMRIVLFDPNNMPFANTGEPLLNLIVNGEGYSDVIEIANIIASDADGNEYRLKSVNGYNYDQSGINSTSENDIHIDTLGSEMILHNACGHEVAVYTVDGRTVARFTPSSDKESLKVGAGMYIVAVGDKVTSVIVK